MFVRIELESPDDFDSSLKRLQSCFAKVPMVYYPPKATKGSKAYGFNFFKFDTLHDWKSISTWCDLDTELGEDPNTCVLMDSHESAANYVGHASLFAKMISQELDFLNKLTFTMTEEGGHFELCLSNWGDRLELTFDFSSLDQDAPESLKVAKKVWGLALKKFPLLKQATVNLEEGLSFEVDEESKKICLSHGGVQLNFDGIAGSKAAIAKCYELASELGKIFESESTYLSVRLTPEEAPAASQAFRNDEDTAAIHFEGRYHQDFHPDLVRDQFPKEGFWHLPMFSVQLGTKDDITPVFLVQTPKERFFEVDVSEAMFKLLKKQLKIKQEFQTWDRPVEKRWDLHKLRQKK